jgi:WD40 repeat protein
MIVLVHKKPGPGYKDANYLLFTPDCRSLIVCGHIGAHLWCDLPAANTRYDLPISEWTKYARFTARGELFTESAGDLELTNLTSRTSRPVDSDGCRVEGVDLTPNGRWIVFCATEWRSGKKWLRCAPLNNPSATAARWSHDIELPRYPQLWCLDDKRYLLVTREKRTRYLVGSIKSGATLHEGEHNLLVYHSLPSPDGRFYVVRSRDQLAIFSTDDFSKPLAVVKNDNRKQFTGIAFHPSGKYLAATSNDETVKVYDTATWEVAHTFTWKIGKMKSVAFSPDGALAAAGSDKGQVLVWDVDL